MASMAPAIEPRKPLAFIKGMFRTPSTTTLATDEPEAVPIRALDTMETLAGPPLARPATQRAKSTKNRPAPEESTKATKSTYRKM
jgi:hypothetical protein